MGLRTCTVSYCDLKGIEHAVEVTADSLCETVAQALRVFRENNCVDEVGRGQTIISVVVRHPEVQYRVRVQDFDDGSNRKGGRLLRQVSKSCCESFSDRKLRLLPQKQEIGTDRRVKG
jgi:hypothetical protein